MAGIEAGRQAFLRLLAELDPAADAVIPRAATDDNFLIGIARGGSRVFVTVAEDDLMDLAEDPATRHRVRAQVAERLGIA